MAISENLQKILDATSGYSSEFQLRDNRLTFRLKIEGTPNSNIKAFISDKFNNSDPIEAFYLKVFCSDWNGAKVTVEVKTNHPEDQFSSCGDQFLKDESKPIYY